MIGESPGTASATASPDTPSLPSLNPSSRPALPAAPDRATGLLSQTTWSEVSRGITTLHTRQVYGTLIGSLYAHYAESRSSVLSPTLTAQHLMPIMSASGSDAGHQTAHAIDATPVVQADLTPVSVLRSSEVNDHILTLHTTQVYETSISGFPAQFTRTTRNIVSSDAVPISQSVGTERLRMPVPSIHFPTPVRSRKLTPSITTITTVTTTTVTATTAVAVTETRKESDRSRLVDDQLHTPINQASNKSQLLAPDEHEERDGSDGEAELEEVDEEYENYAHDDELGETGDSEIRDDERHRHLLARHRPPREENAQPFLSLEDEEEDPESRSDGVRKTESPPTASLFADLNERVTAPAPDSVPPAANNRLRQDMPLRYAGVFGQRVSHRHQKPTDQKEKQSDAVSRQRSSHSHSTSDRPPNHRQVQRKQSPAPNRYPSAVPDPQSNGGESRTGGHRSRGSYNRRSRPANDSHRHAVTPTARPTNRRNDSPRHRLLDHRSRSVDDPSVTPTRRFIGKRRNHGKTVTTTTIILAPTIETHTLVSPVTSPTPSLSTFLPKSLLTVTSIASWTKTLPIRHGFRTSYATITSSGFNTSLIRADEYEIRVDPTNSQHLLTVLNQDRTDAQVIVTSTLLSEVKLVPIRVGYSTRTETQTSSYVLTTLKTIYTIPVRPPSSFTFLTSAVPHVTTETLTATSVVSFVVAGKTLLSTLTSTSLREATITTTKTLPLPISPTSSTTVIPFLFTTLVTFQLTGDAGHVTNVVTPITLPIPAPHTKVERRAIRPSARPESHVMSSVSPTGHPALPQPPILFTSFSAPAPALLPCQTDNCLTQSLTTMFKGPSSELYRETAVLVKEVHAPSHQPAVQKEDKYATDGFKRRKLHQFNEDFAFRPQSPKPNPFFRDFSRVVPLPQSFAGSDKEGKPMEGGPVFAPLPPPQGNSNFGTRPGFQRVKVSNPFPRIQPQQQAPQPLPPQPPAGFSPVADNSPFSRFQRVVAPATDSRPQSNFRRVPVFSSQLPPSQPQLPAVPPQSTPAPSTPSLPFREDDTPVPLVITPTARPSERPAFRRLRPGAQTAGRRVKPVVSSRIRDNSENTATLAETTTPAATSPVTSDVPDIGPVSSPESRRVVRIRKPGSAGGSRRRVAVRPPTSSTIRVPIQRNPVDDERVNNALDTEESPNNVAVSSFGSRLQEDTVGAAAPLLSSVTGPTLLPITYYTTYTYQTTVLRGSHTLTTSRLSSTSSVSTQALDASLIHFLKQSSGSIVPTQVVNVGTKTKGPTTTIVNVASQIRATHSDLAHIFATAAAVPAKTTTTTTTTTSRNTRKPVIEGPSSLELQTIPLSQLDRIPKTYLTKYTYYYTIIDGSNTRRSTRSEVASSRAAGNYLLLFCLYPLLSPFSSKNLISVTKSTHNPVIYSR